MAATKNAHDWHCERHDTYGWRGEACKQCPEAPSEITKLQANLEVSTVRLNESLYQQSRLQAENEALRKEAERYRFLKKQQAEFQSEPYRMRCVGTYGEDLYNLDAAIDAAIEQAKGGA